MMTPNPIGTNDPISLRSRKNVVALAGMSTLADRTCKERMNLSRLPHLLTTVLFRHLAITVVLLGKSESVYPPKGIAYYSLASVGTRLWAEFQHPHRNSRIYLPADGFASWLTS